MARFIAGIDRTRGLFQRETLIAADAYGRTGMVGAMLVAVIADLIRA